MKKILLLSVLLLLAVLPAKAGEEDFSGGVESLMQHTNMVENAFAGQKQITDEEFEKTYQQVKAKHDRKKKKNRPFKGQNFNEENNGTYIDETAEKNLILSVPLDLVNGDGAEVPIGHYRIVGKKNKEGVYLDFYQSSKLVAEVPAIETNYDFDNSKLNFVELQPYNEERIKVIYGSLDFNAYTFIRIKNKITD